MHQPLTMPNQRNCVCEVVDTQWLQISHKCEGHSTVFHGTCAHFGIILHLGLKNLTASPWAFSIYNNDNNNNKNNNNNNNNNDGVFFAKIVNVLRSLAIFAEELHRECLTALSVRFSLIAYYSTKKVWGKDSHHWGYTRESWTSPAS